MPASKPPSLSATGARRRGRGRAANDGATPPPTSVEWVARLDALALALAELPERTAIIERSVREVMHLLPADSVTLRGEPPAADAAPGPQTIPLEVGGRRFGALELGLKPERSPDAAERTLLLAIGRQCALALARLEASERPLNPEAVGAALDGVTAGLRALVSVARSAALPSPRRIAEAERMAIAHLDDLRRRVGG